MCFSLSLYFKENVHNTFQFNFKLKVIQTNEKMHHEIKKDNGN